MKRGLAICFFLLIELMYVQSSARADLIFATFAPSVYNANTSQMDIALGLTSHAIEDFEDTTLLPNLSYSLTNPPGGTFTALPATATFAGNEWDGTNVLFNTSNNTFGGPTSNTITFTIAGGATSIGFGLSNFQSLSLPSQNGFPITDHELFVNGVSQGTIETIAAATMAPGQNIRNLYLKIDADSNGTVNSINTVAFTNLVTNPSDILAFDHIAIVPEVNSFVMLTVAGIVGGSCVWMKRFKRRLIPTTQDN
jgi:hypothetical protein